MTQGPIQCDVGVTYGISRKGLPSPASFKRWAEAACKGRIKFADIAIRIVDEKEGRALNKHYRGKDYATNVLSFPAELPEGITLPLLGDLLICAPIVAKEAKAQNKILNAHYAHLTIHGVLHLLGLDHEDEHEAVAMEAIEREILADMGYPDPYQE
ncbi:MAG TPA: rRNA maturation RNase YbeY [Arenimonas sp.]|nr:rRNA maturation RNase YbeY [Arenimonas sp.]